MNDSERSVFASTVAYKFHPNPDSNLTSSNQQQLLATRTSMALRTVLAVALLIVAVAAPPAAAQLLGGLGNIMISGTVPCSPDATTITATTPVFPNATVLLQCGENMVASTVTNSNGVFSMLLGANPLTQLLSSLLGSCKLVVPTPLSACNSMLSSTGFLESPLQLLSGNGFLGGILGGLRNVIPSLFKLVP